MEYLKIKDNADLKELEKFGFKKQFSFNEYCFEDGFANCAISIWDEGGQQNRRILVSDNINCIDNTPILLKLYDLIQAGLVEKVVK